MTFSYTPRDVCSKRINIEIEDDVVTRLSFDGGCNGNLKGISALAIGMKVDDVIARLRGISCGGRPTSCPDQLASALEGYKMEKNG